MPFVIGEAGEVKLMLDELHRRKIEMSHAIFVVNPDGYLGPSTSNEVWYATSLGKQVFYAYGS